MTTQSNPNLAVATVDSARQFLTSKEVQQQLAHMADRHMTPDHMCRLVLTAVQKTPRLLECFANPAGKRSIGLAMLTAGQSGLPIDGRLSHIVPFKNKAGYMEAVWMPDYKGLIQLGYNHPKVAAIWAEAVYENDHFVYRKGINVVLEHTPTMSGDPGALHAAYAVCKLTTGDVVTAVLPRREVERIRSSSRGSDDPSSPWNTAEGQMWIKSAVRQLCKLIPQSKELQKVLEVESEFEETGTMRNSVTIDVSPQPEIRFGKKNEESSVNALPVVAEVVESNPAAVESQEQSSTASPAASDGGQKHTADRARKSAKKPQETASVQPAPAEVTPAAPPAQEEDHNADAVETFFSDKCPKATCSDVMATMKRLKPAWPCAATAYADIPDAQRKELWSGRAGIQREVNRDIESKKAA